MTQQIKITQTSNADMNIGIPKKLTAVEWLVEQLEVFVTLDEELAWDKLFEKAKQMEKEQIIDSHKNGFTEGTCFGASPTGYKFITSEQYYNETYNK